MIKKLFIIFFAIIILCARSFSQVNDVLSYVNPFIGTTSSGVVTKWGSEGGTYPGAAAPSGYIQLTPETQRGGYDYTDSSIYYFSCLNHSSGFPGGSSGNLFVMPVNESNGIDPLSVGRAFHHKNEKAEPGYYSVHFNDDGTFVEATATERTGIFRITFQPGVIPKIFIGDAGVVTLQSDKIIHGSKNSVVININEDYIDKRQVKDGIILSFSSSLTNPTVIILMLSASPVGTGSAQKNLDAEKNKSFDTIEKSTKNKWDECLAVIEINDSNKANKQKFYTALYHSLLIPWIVSDVDGKYKGADGLIHATGGHYEYGKFSPWDTYRSLHPLLSLLYPQKQADVLLSMMNFYRQSGHLPVESMTGNHAIQVIVDAYVKGFKDIDPKEVYTAMKKQILTGPFIQNDMDVYNKMGYIPSTYPESVTRTVEYAYDDWALAQFAKKVMKNNFDYNSLAARSYNYKNIFYTDSMFLLPRNKNEFLIHPGNIGYKEGDEWVYSYSVPYNTKDLINLMGGDVQFVSRLDSALTNGQIIFDNETAFHVPYLFNFAGRADLTQKWIRKIIDNRFADTPAGLPGNDDLGSTSSWLVLSAMGMYPFCPGVAAYIIGSPLFESVTIHLTNKKIFHIKCPHVSAANYYVNSLMVNNKPYKQLFIPHSMIMKGGEMLFDVTGKAGTKWFNKNPAEFFSETKQSPDFTIFNYSVSKKKVFPDEDFSFRFSIKNNGERGTKVVKLSINGKDYNFKYCFVNPGSTVSDSINCRLYIIGKANLIIDRKIVASVSVVKPPYHYPDKPSVSALMVQPIVKRGDDLATTFSVQNTGGAARTFYIPLQLNGVPVKTDTVFLLPGEQKNLSEIIMPDKEGLQEIEVYKNAKKFKVYNAYKDALILNLKLIDANRNNSIVQDISGFDNNAIIISSTKGIHSEDTLLLSKDCYVEVPNGYSLDHLDSSITVMAWVFPKGSSGGLTDMITKGDNHVLQLVGNKQLTFFAGGWGRGDCTVDLPVNWLNNWHHIAGVCDGKSLKIYLDGVLKGTTVLRQVINLSNTNKWTIGRNEEFPMQRIFTGYIDKMKVFETPLKQEEIVEEMK